jgi:hypothetical protein
MMSVAISTLDGLPAISQSMLDALNRQAGLDR